VHNNASTDAGLFWPGFLDVDIWTPGRQWVAEHHKNETLRKKKERDDRERIARAAKAS